MVFNLNIVDLTIKIYSPTLRVEISLIHKFNAFLALNRTGLAGTVDHEFSSSRRNKLLLLANLWPCHN
jgi:hypothetical protein